MQHFAELDELERNETRRHVDLDNKLAQKLEQLTLAKRRLKHQIIEEYSLSEKMFSLSKRCENFKIEAMEL